MSSEILKFAPLLFTICFVTFCFWAFFRLKNTFVKSARICFKKYGTFIGRASRSEFWYFILFNLCVIFFISILAIVTSLITEGNFKPWHLAQYFPLMIIAEVVLLIPTIAATARRLHDINKSGWWQLISYIPYVGFVGVILIIVWCCKDGDKKKNKFG